jgi:gamma-glutamyltranspeptidase/glutathione hydrolase
VRERAFTVLPVLLCALALVLTAPGGRAKPAVAKLAVATEHPLVTRAALDILVAGGNAVDAAAAAALVAGVVSPTSSGLGGGGFALVLRPGESRPKLLDFREVAPRALDASMLERRPLPAESRGHLVGVPAEARGLYELVRRFGKRAWADVVAPAERRARLGFAVGPHLARTLQSSAKALRDDPTLDALYYPGGRALLLGRIVKNPKLAATLKRLGAEGPAALYDGVIAEEMVRTARDKGSALTTDDLRDYQVVEREPLQIRWEGYEIYTMPAPSAGGLVLAETLGMFSRAELVRLGYQSPAYQHILAEAFRSALIDRFRYFGDPARVPVDMSRLLDPARLAQRRKALSFDRTHSLPVLAAEEHGTHHMSFADADGMVVSLTTTVNRTFGAKLVAPESGIVLNDQLDDFTLTSDLAALGLRENPNAPLGGVRPVSSMTPTIVLENGRPVLALGGAGGMAIGTNVTQVLLGRLAFGRTPEELVAAPRFLVPTRKHTIMVEEGASPELLDELAYRGERIRMFKFNTTAVQLIALEKGSWLAAADPRKFGSAATR